MPMVAGFYLSRAKTKVGVGDERGLMTWRASCATSPR
jgi:hypothetical protein